MKNKKKAGWGSLVRLLDSVSYTHLDVYKRQLSWMVAMVSGVVLSLTSVLLMCFYIKQFVDDHKEQLGILKALGYSNGQLAKRFWAFGLSFGVGALLGYFASFLMMGHFYDFRNEKGILPDITIHFHWQLLVALVLSLIHI